MCWEFETDGASVSKDPRPIRLEGLTFRSYCLSSRLYIFWTSSCFDAMSNDFGQEAKKGIMLVS